jgi:hypothetical protein
LFGFRIGLNFFEMEITLSASNLQALLLEVDKITACEEGNRHTAICKFGPVVEAQGP